MDDNNQKSLRQLFEKLPEKIKDWLTSERTTYVIISINDRLGIDDVLRKVIPTLITRLTVKDLPPQNFIKELSRELDIEIEESKIIAQDIEQQILKFIEVPLRTQVGVDIKLIYFTGEAKLASPILEVMKEQAPRPITPSPLIQTQEAAHPSASSGQVPSASSGQVPSQSAPSIVKIPINVTASKPPLPPIPPKLPTPPIPPLQNKNLESNS